MSSDQGWILTVDSDEDVATALREILAGESYHVVTVGTCSEALDSLKQTQSDVVLLDLEGEGLARIELMKRIRARHPETSVILVTSHASAASAILALRHGAHDYLVKPLTSQNLRESVMRGVAKAQRKRRERLLLAKLEDLIRIGGQHEPIGRHGPASPVQANGANGTHNSSLQDRGPLIDHHQRRVRRNGTWINLTPTEFTLLTYLMQHPGEVQGYRKLVREVQGYDADEWEARNLVKYYVHCLRQKLEPHPAEPRYILNVRGVGYLFAGNPHGHEVPMPHTDAG